eukprot:112711_1
MDISSIIKSSNLSNVVQKTIDTQTTNDNIIINTQKQQQKETNIIAKTSINDAIETTTNTNTNINTYTQHKDTIHKNELIGNEPLTQGARSNQTSIGTALLSIKMSGLKQRLTPSTTATASIDPYNTNKPHSQLISTDKFGPNVVTQARPQTQTQIIPEIIKPHTQSYQFQSVQQQLPQQQQQQQTHMQPQYVMIPTPINTMNGYPTPMYYPPPPHTYPYGAYSYISPMNGQPMSTHNHSQSINNKNKKNMDISEDTMSGISSKRGNKRNKRKSKNDKRDKYININEEERNVSQVKNLFTKAINNRHSGVEEMLASNTDPNTKDEHGNTILHVAAQNGNKRLIKIALRWGGRINEQNKQGQTALHYLFAYKYENLAAYLISKGADDTIQNEFGYTCYDGLRPSQ